MIKSEMRNCNTEEQGNKPIEAIQSLDLTREKNQDSLKIYYRKIN